MQPSALLACLLLAVHADGGSGAGSGESIETSRSGWLNAGSKHGADRGCDELHALRMNELGRREIIERIEPMNRKAKDIPAQAELSAYQTCLNLRGGGRVPASLQRARRREAKEQVVVDLHELPCIARKMSFSPSSCPARA